MEFSPKCTDINLEAVHGIVEKLKEPIQLTHKRKPADREPKQELTARQKIKAEGLVKVAKRGVNQPGLQKHTSGIRAVNMVNDDYNG